VPGRRSKAKVSGASACIATTEADPAPYPQVGVGLSRAQWPRAAILAAYERSRGPGIGMDPLDLGPVVFDSAIMYIR